ncbi:hypothetical protein AVEN_17973-1 [Araneus ventricosus]|uniref:Integrase zinc-binding domain-containing protein n=1 Tax=Araneus ventricosus TaxID=182803 RepID=A0A4Y2F0X4_ARAVE|nr:hypothetical protein AVEN_17973-1 [Araneus ventricosus]
MKLKGLGEECVNHGLFGGIEHAETHQRYRINLSNVDGSYNFVLDVLDEEKICASLPKMNDAHCLNQLKDMGILISDVAINERSCLYEMNPGEIHLLIGADYAGKLLTGNIKHLSGSLVAVQTLLGWTVMGKSYIINTNKSSLLLVLSLHVNNAKISDLWNLDSLGIKEDSAKRTKTETQELALEHFRETVSRDSTDRYKVEEPLRSLAVKLKDSLYVDNCVASVDSVSELEHFKTETQRILKTAKFDLRGWKNNFLPEIGETVQDSSGAVEEKEVSVLGLTWDREEDTLSCELIRTENEGEPITKRKILSVAHQLFDPIGFTCPITLIPNLLLQECWKLGISWDSKLPEDVIKKFKKWKDELHELKFLKIPRRLSNLDLNESNLTLHTFCDASKLAYATCIFLRAEKEGKLTCQLIQARSRIAPLKGISIPRMELLAYNIGARLANYVKKDLNLVDIESFIWSDSMDALHWIKKEGPWMTFVSNRVNEIRRLSEAYEWKFVPGTQNPADLPSRGFSVKTLLKKQWYEGPPWLRDSRDKWPDFELSTDENIIYAEKKKTVVSSLNKKNDEFYNNISSYKKIIRITGWMYRFYENSKGFNKKSGELSEEEIKRAELKILKKIQEDSFHNENTQRLKLLETFTDAYGISRVKTELTMREEDDNFKVPIVLPSDHHVVKSLILYKHEELGHPGVQSLMVALRENYWILKSRKTIKKIIKTCIICQRFSVKQPEIPEGTLPEDRVKMHRFLKLLEWT